MLHHEMRPVHASTVWQLVPAPRLFNGSVIEEIFWLSVESLVSVQVVL